MSLFDWIKSFFAVDHLKPFYGDDDSFFALVSDGLLESGRAQEDCEIYQWAALNLEPDATVGEGMAALAQASIDNINGFAWCRIVLHGRMSQNHLMIFTNKVLMAENSSGLAYHIWDTLKEEMPSSEVILLGRAVKADAPTLFSVMEAYLSDNAPSQLEAINGVY